MLIARSNGVMISPTTASTPRVGTARTTIRIPLMVLGMARRLMFVRYPWRIVDHELRSADGPTEFLRSGEFERRHARWTTSFARSSASGHCRTFERQGLRPLLGRNQYPAMHSVARPLSAKSRRTPIRQARRRQSAVYLRRARSTIAAAQVANNRRIDNRRDPSPACCIGVRSV